MGSNYDVVYSVNGEFNVLTRVWMKEDNTLEVKSLEQKELAFTGIQETTTETDTTTDDTTQPDTTTPEDPSAVCFKYEATLGCVNGNNLE
jgi:hypothetical protein